MKKYFLSLAIIAALITAATSQLSAQVRMGFGPFVGGRYYSRSTHHRQAQSSNNQSQNKEEIPKFIPTVNISVGYGFPNLDKYLLPDLTSHHVNIGDYEQTGIIHAALDYQFGRFTSIGVMGFYGKTSAPYYNFGALPNDPPTYNASLESWSVMINMVNYFAPVDMAKVNAYIRTAVGVNVWNQRITDPSGVKQNNLATNPTEFAYQASLGADFNLSPRAAIFLEAGYGKYILTGGLKFKF